jgi:hypothetical protein
MEFLRDPILPGNFSANLHHFDHGRIDALHLPNIQRSLREGCDEGSNRQLALISFVDE